METKVPIEDAINMSLDEYINKADIIDPVGLSKGRNRFKNGNHQSDSDDDTSDVEMSVPAKEYFDFTTGDMPNPRSQQWRLMPLNIQAYRPSGMPPLMPISAGNVQSSLRSRSAMNNAKQRQQANDSTPPATHAGHPQNGTTSKSNDLTIQVDTGAGTTNGSAGDAGNCQKPGKRWRPNQKSRWNNHNNNNNAENGGGVMRPYNQFKHDRLSVHQRIDHTYLSRKQSHDQHPGMLQPLTAPPVATSFALQPFSSATLVAGITSSIANATEATFVKHCIDAFPSVTSKLLEQIEAMHRAKMDKKYDLKVQKEIAEVQGKTLMYTCPGAAVVSSDGPGIEAVAPQPHATDVSMNQRFS